jgi:hypothetical protein
MRRTKKIQKQNMKKIQNKKTKKIQKQNMKKIQNKKTKKIQKQNMKKGGWLEDAQKKTCTNYKEGKNFFTIKDENDNDITFGDGESINQIRAENLSMFPNNTCFYSKTMASYIRYLLSNGIKPGHSKFVTPTEPKVQIEPQMLENFNIVPKDLVEAFNVVVDTDYRPPDVKEEEERLRCILIGSDKLYRFVSNMWFNLIQKVLNLPLRPDGTKYVPDLALEQMINTSYRVDSLNKTEDRNVIAKPGYLCGTINICAEILKLKTDEDFYRYNKENNISFLQLMGAFYQLPGHSGFIRGLIDTDTVLQGKFMTAIQLFFKVPDTMTYDEYSNIIDQSYTPWFYPWVYTYLVNRKTNLIHQIKGGDDDVYIRRRATSTGDDLIKTPVKNIKCKEKQFENYNNPNLELIFGNSYVTPRDNGIWYNTLKRYKKQMISGPSGSTVFMYQMMFDLSKILEKNETNEIMLLMALLADYTGTYHSTTEILQVYVEEAETFIDPKYNLELNDTEYIHDLMRNVGLLSEAAPTAAAAEDTGAAAEGL